MYDNVKLYGYYLVDDVSGFINGLSKVNYNGYNGSGVRKMTGKLKNLDVILTGNKITIKNSLAKFKNTENITHFSRCDAKEVIEEVGDSLHIDAKNMILGQLEFGPNLLMDNSIESYLSILGDKPYFRKDDTYLGSICYKTTPRDSWLRREFKLYDKKAEMHCVIPEAYSNANVLRVEGRWYGRLPQQLKTGREITAEMMCNENFYNAMKQQIIKEYQSIRKYPRMEIDYTSIKKPSDCKDVLLAYLVEQNPSIVAQFMENVKTAGVFNRQQMRRAKGSIIEGCKNGITLSNDLIKELDSKIMSIADYD